MCKRMCKRVKTWIVVLIALCMIGGTIFCRGMKVEATDLKNDELNKYDLLSASSKGDVTKVFTDIPKGEWFVNAVQFVYDQDIMKGVSDKTFGPKVVLTREQFITVLYNMEGAPKITFKKKYNDVTDSKAWYAKPVTWAAENKITSGVGNNLFGTGEEITREQLATLLYNYAQQKKEYKLDIDADCITRFADAKKVSKWATTGMKWAVTNGVMGGKTGNVLDPLGKATRAECAQMIMNLKKNAVKKEEQQEQQNQKEISELDFGEKYAQLEKMMKEAVAQYKAEDYTRLKEPVKYNVLWIGYTRAVYGNLDFRMTDFDKEFLKAVTLNYEKTVEQITNHNLDISVDLYFEDNVTFLTADPNEGFVYIGTDTVRPLVNRYSKAKQYDMVFTTIQTSGIENTERNKAKAYYKKHTAILGIALSNISSGLCHASFDLGLPAASKYPLKNPEEPAFTATAVAVHEWMHTLEPIGSWLGIEYPNTHAYFGPEHFPGYKKYIGDEKDFDYFEFYRLVLAGKAPYTQGSKVKHVGMYPKMWPLVKSNLSYLGSYVIRNANGNNYLTARETEPTLVLTSKPFVWNVYCVGIGRYALIPKEYPDKRIDLSNAWDAEENSIGIWEYTGYEDAQSWRLISNKDGSIMIQTNYESGRVLTIKGRKNATLNTIGSEGVQNWIFEKSSSTQ